MIPDFIANCGMARVFSYLMNPNCVINEKMILNDIRNCVALALNEIISKDNSLRLLATRCVENALNKIEAREAVEVT